MLEADGGVAPTEDEGSGAPPAGTDGMTGCGAWLVPLGQLGPVPPGPPPPRPEPIAVDPAIGPPGATPCANVVQASIRAPAIVAIAMVTLGMARISGPLWRTVKLPEPVASGLTSAMRWPDVFLVNGPSSAGKSTLCRALQSAVERPYLVAGFDDFIFMSAPRYYRGADTAKQGAFDAYTALGAEMIVTSRPGEPVSVTAQFGPVFRKLVDSMAPAVRALVDGGNSVIFDHVLHDEAMYLSCEEAFAGLDVLSVGVICAVEILEERERSRGDRVLGRARGLADIVHTFMPYDVTIDTGVLSPQECVAAVLAAVEARP